MTNRGLVWNIQRFCLHDGSGIRTTVFFMGCPLRCLWCANPEGLFDKPVIKYNSDLCIGCKRCVEICPVGANSMKNNKSIIDRSLCSLFMRCIEKCPTGARSISGKYMFVEEILKIVRREQPFYRRSGGGLTCSGGEPLQQSDFIEKLLFKAKEENIDTAIETCGAVEWNNIFQVIDYTDMFFYDLKHMDSEKHKKLTGTDNKIIIENAKKLINKTSKVVFRMPIIPGLNDDENNLSRTALFLDSIKAKELEILPYHMYGVNKYKMFGLKYKLNNTEVPENSYMLKIKRLITEYNINLNVRIA